jgi:hypothetical protein
MALCCRYAPRHDEQRAFPNVSCRRLGKRGENKMHYANICKRDIKAEQSASLTASLVSQWRGTPLTPHSPRNIVLSLTQSTNHRGDQGRARRTKASEGAALHQGGRLRCHHRRQYHRQLRFNQQHSSLQHSAQHQSMLQLKSQWTMILVKSQEEKIKGSDSFIAYSNACNSITL